MRAGGQGRRPRRRGLRPQPRAGNPRPRRRDHPSQVRLHALRPHLGPAGCLREPVGAVVQLPHPLHRLVRFRARPQVLLHRAAFRRQLLQPRRLLRLCRRAHALRLLLQGRPGVPAQDRQAARRHPLPRLADRAGAGAAVRNLQVRRHGELPRLPHDAQLQAPGHRRRERARGSPAWVGPATTTTATAWATTSIRPPSTSPRARSSIRTSSPPCRRATPGKCASASGVTASATSSTSTRTSSAACSTDSTTRCGTRKRIPTFPITTAPATSRARTGTSRRCGSACCCARKTSRSSPTSAASTCRRAST